MKVRNLTISSELEIDDYLIYFKKLSESKIILEIDMWENKIKNDNYNHYEFLAFLKVLDLLESNKSSNDIQTISVLINTIEELKGLSDYTLDQYQGTERQTKLLDDINRSLTECELLYKYYNEKIIN